MSTPLLVLLDIDGTLVWKAAEAHARSVMAAITEVHGPLELGPVDAAGRTDRWIVRAMLRRAGVSDADIDASMDELLAIAARRYEHSCPADLSHTVLPGIPALLERLADDAGVLLGLVTGNIASVAHRKLTAAGLAAPLQPWLGAYGSDAEQRDALVPIAQARAAERAGLASPWPGEATVIVGDTPHDIACARAAGARVIAVTTGAFGRDALGTADAIADTAGELEAALESLAAPGG